MMRGLFLVLAMVPTLAHAGAYLFSEGANVLRVTHPVGYNGTQSGEIVVDVCLDPSAPAAAVIPTRNAVATFNRMMATLGNKVSSSSVGNTSNRPDYESVLLHEVGHCIGMDHSTLGPSELGTGNLGDPQLFYTIATAGSDGDFNTAVGPDNVKASRDDVRGDDVNRHWFKIGGPTPNNPFEIPSGRVDRTTYSVSQASLPLGHTYVEAATSFAPCRNANEDTSTLRSQPATQNVMFPVLCQNNVYRDLSPGDVSTLLIARAGADGNANNTADNYTVRLNYIGVAASCGLRIEFVNNAGFALCSVQAQVGTNNNIFITSSIARFQTFGTGSGQVNWWFNPTDTSGPTDFTLTIAKSGSGSGTVTSAPAGINCGPTCSAAFDADSSVTLTASPAGGSFFGGWSGGGCSGTGPCIVTMSANRSVSASFGLIPPPPPDLIFRSNLENWDPQYCCSAP